MFIEFPDESGIKLDAITGYFKDDRVPGKSWCITLGHTARHVSDEDMERIRALLPMCPGETNPITIFKEHDDMQELGGTDESGRQWLGLDRSERRR